VRTWARRATCQRPVEGVTKRQQCLEEINRIDGMRLLMAEAHEKKASVPGLRENVREWWKEKVGTTTDTPDAVVVYAMT